MRLGSTGEGAVQTRGFPRRDVDHETREIRMYRRCSVFLGETQTILPEIRRLALWSRQGTDWPSQLVRTR